MAPHKKKRSFDFMKRFLSLFLALAMCFSLTAPAFATAGVEEPKMVDIELIITDDYGVVVSVPEDKAEEYRQRLESDPEFRQSEIDTALAFTSPARYTRPEGIIDYEQYMYESDIKRVVDAYSGGGVYNKWKQACGYVFTTASIVNLISKAGCTTAISFASVAMQLAIAIVTVYEEAWWTESYRLICAGEISAVLYLIIQNSGEYPKAWRVFERVP